MSEIPPGNLMDIFDAETRSRVMASVRSKDTKLEIAVRSSLFRLGFRYRIHDKRLPGSPDLVLKKYNTVIFINGCFWHMHGCKYSTIPKTREEWWKVKLESNKKRDLRNYEQLHQLGWRVILLWECAYRSTGSDTKPERLLHICQLIINFFTSNSKLLEIQG